MNGLGNKRLIKTKNILVYMTFGTFTFVSSICPACCKSWWFKLFTSSWSSEFLRPNGGWPSSFSLMNSSSDDNRFLERLSFVRFLFTVNVHSCYWISSISKSQTRDDAILYGKKQQQKKRNINMIITVLMQMTVMSKILSPNILSFLWWWLIEVVGRIDG